MMGGGKNTGDVGISQSLPSDWATWQLLDSLLPTGGFAHSYGLESALQAGLIGGSGGLENFIVTALENTGSLVLPFLCAAHQSAQLHLAELQQAEQHGNEDLEQGRQQTERGNAWSPAVRRWVVTDSILNAALSNHVARRASTAQGGALLRLAVSVFPEASLLKDMRIRTRKGGDKGADKLQHRGGEVEYRNDIIAGEISNSSSNGKGDSSSSVMSETSDSLSECDTWPVSMHHAPIFGTICGTVGIDVLVTQRSYLFTALRDMLSAATRLNVIGPLESATLQRKLAPLAEKILLQSANRPISSAYQIAPLFDLVQGSHDSLFSRLFSS